MGSLYPAGLDSFPTNKVAGQIHLASLQNDVDDAVNLIEAELGTSPSGSAATVADRLDDIEASVTQEGPLNVEWPEYGADPSGTETANTTAVQAAIDDIPAAGGQILLPGSYPVNDNITIPTDRQITIRGMGKLVSGLTWDTDLGSSQYGIDATGTDFQKFHLFADLKLQGPGGALTMGTAPANMDGVELYRNWSMDRCSVQGFRSGVVMNGDHQSLNYCDVSACYYNIYYPDGFVTKGNQHFQKCELDGAAFANVAVSGTNTLDSSVFTNCHFGVAPIGFYRETYVSSSFLKDTLIESCSFEQMGNACFYDESWAASSTSTDGMYGVTLVSMAGVSQDDTYKYASKSSAASWNVGMIKGLKVISGGNVTTAGFPFFLATANTSIIRAETVTGCDFGNLAYAINTAQTASKPVFSIADTAGHYGNYAEHRSQAGYSQSPQLELVRCTGAVSQFDLVQGVSSNTPEVTKYTTGNPYGVAMHSLSGAGMLLVATEGRVYINSAGNAISAAAKVKPDTSNNGAVVTVGAATDLPKVGYALAGSSGGTTFTKLMLTL